MESYYHSYLLLDGFAKLFWSEYSPYDHIYLWLENSGTEAVEFITDFEWEDA